MPTIFTNMSRTDAMLMVRSARGSNTWAGYDSNQLPLTLSGVFKPRATSDLPGDRANDLGDATLNVLPNYIEDNFRVGNDPDPAGVIGCEARVNNIRYTVTGIDAAKNMRTGRIEHYRLHLRREATRYS